MRRQVMPIMPRLSPGYLVFIVLFAIVWSFVFDKVSLRLAAAEDNPDMSAPVPGALKVGYELMKFPACFLLSEQGLPKTVGERTAVQIFEFCIMINGCLWAVLLLILFLAVPNVATEISAN